jgi:carboxymethylenebutenolidase
MWNSFSTDAVPGMTAGVTDITTPNGDRVRAYVARPTGDGPFPGIVLAHHMPGWDEFYLEMTRRFATHGYIAISPDLYQRAGSGKPDDVTAKVRAEGGVPDDQVVNDLVGASQWVRSQPDSNGKVGVVGTCSGGRHALLAASRAPGDFDVVAAKEALTAKQPVAPVDYTKDLQAPLLGIFGNDDQAPSPAEVDTHEAELKKHGKDYEFHRYDGAGHGIFYYDRPLYRQQQAMDGWNKVFEFFKKHLGGK